MKKERYFSLYILFIALIVIVYSRSYAEVYRYVDENGVWHFSNVPIPGSKYELFSPKNKIQDVSTSLGTPTIKEVLAAQIALESLGYNPGKLDGICGKKTQEALERYQKDKGLKVTGRLDKQTKLRLKPVTNEKDVEKKPNIPLSTTYIAEYDISLESVERPDKPKKRYGDTKIDRIQESGESMYQFEDEMLKISWRVGPKGIAFALINKTNYSIRIIWDEAAFVDENELSHRVMHSGVKYIDRNNPQPPTVVVRKGKITDVIAPTDYVNWENFRSIRVSGHWEKLPLLPTSENGDSPYVLESKVRPYIGKTIQILLPLKIEDVVNDYLFTFRINNVDVTPKDSSRSDE